MFALARERGIGHAPVRGHSPARPQDGQIGVGALQGGASQESGGGRTQAAGGRRMDAAAELAAAREAGWRRADLRWERLQEEANERLCAGDVTAAARLFRRAGWIAFWRFRDGDPRRATTLANLALADRMAGRGARALRRYARARAAWEAAEGFIAGMRIARRVRSARFDASMEGRHWETFRQNMRIRMTAICRETGAALAALERDERVARPRFARWAAERPPVFDDTRKLLAAALLVAVPPPDGPPGGPPGGPLGDDAGAR